MQTATTQPIPRHETPFPAGRLALLAVLLGAFALRTYRLDFQSFWSDEGISLNRARLPLGELLATLPAEHSPGYFVALHGWVRLAGEHDFGLRYWSVLGSVLAVALLARLGAALGLGSRAAQWAGVAAAALLATGWFQVWYAQETRMYAWLPAAALAASWALWELLHSRGRRQAAFAALYAVAVAACVYSHYYGALVALAHVVFMVGWLIATRRVQPFGVWVAAAAGGALLFAPWLPRALGVLGFGGWRAADDPNSIPWRYFSAYLVGGAMPEPLRAWLPWVYLVLAALGVAFWWRQGPAAALFLLAGALVPLAAVYALALRNPDFHERYAIVLAGPLVLLVAGGINIGQKAKGKRQKGEAESRDDRAVGLAAGIETPAWNSKSRLKPTGGWIALVITVVLVGMNLAALERHYFDPALHKPDFRGAAQRIQQNERTGDVILVDGPAPDLVFNHYYSGALPVHDLRAVAQRDSAEVGEALAGMTVDAQRAWEVLFFHEPEKVQMWLATEGWATEPTYHNNIRVTLYGLADAAPVAPEQRALGLAVGPALTLAASTVDKTRVQAGDVVQVTTEWQVAQPAPDYKFSLRLMDAGGQVALAQDYVPQNWFAPTSVWAVGEQARDRRGILIPADLAPGTYTLTLRVYDPATGAAVETAAGQDVPLATVAVGA
jgi:hypothetical protein